MARARESSRFSFLCEGTMESLSAPVPTSMLEIYPEKVQSEAVVPLRGIRRSVCPRLFESKNCNTSNCSYLHPNFLNEQRVVPDIICHKWFQGCCDRGSRCWNQHGFAFDAALCQALRVQNQLRGDEPPYNYSSDDGGVIRQVNREKARAWIQKSMAHFRHTQIRKWHFGTNFTRYYDYEAWNVSPEADALREELAARDNEPYRGRSPRHTSSRRSSSRVPAAWSDRAKTPRRSGLFPPAESSFPSAPSSSTHRKSFFQVHTDTDSEASAPSFGAGARPAFRPGDGAGLTHRFQLLARDPSPAQRWLAGTPVITEIMDGDDEHAETTRRGTPKKPASEIL